MAASAARHSFGAHLQVDFAGGTTYADVGECYTITVGDFTVTSADITNLNSPGAAKEKLPGFIDGGQPTFSLNFTEGAYNSLIGALRKKLNWRIQFPLTGAQVTNAQLTFTAHLTKIPNNIPEDGKVDLASITVDISGLPVFTAGS